jgi:uncharacterized OB-fold protein
VPAPPRPDVHSSAFWDGLRQQRVVVQHCQNCLGDFFPHLPGCPRCASRKLVDRVVSGTGTVYSWVRVDRELSEDSVPVPYAIVTVDLDVEPTTGAPIGPVPAVQAEIPLACRMFGRLVPHEAAAVGLAVEATFTDHGSWTELLFTPRSAIEPTGQPTGQPTETRTP